ncbi:MAG: DUF2807 domain-containing protein [Magnetococcales bacterium]|nr:DUF2807 domain-containing protein [Magnetococcales bacterium]
MIHCKRGCPDRSVGRERVRWELFPGVFFMILWSGMVQADEKEPFWSGRVDKVRLENIFHPIQIHTHGQPQTVVRVAGPLTRDALGIQQRGGQLTIQGKAAEVHASGSGNVSVTTSYGSIQQTVVGDNAKGVIEIGGLPVASSTSGGKPIQLNLLVPKGTPVTIAGTCHLVEIDSTAGPLDVDVNGACDLKAGNMGPTNLRIDGAGDVDIASVSKKLTITALGASNIQIKGGDVESLQVDLNGSGDVFFGGVARKVKVGLQGVGNVTVTKSLSDPEIKIDGVGDVSIGR